MSTLQVHLLGRLQIRYDDTPLPPLPTQKGKSLLAYLVLHPNHDSMRTLLVGLLWPDAPESQGRRALSQNLWQLRQVLGPAADRLVTSEDCVCFSLHAADYIDTLDFQAACTLSPTANPSEQIKQLERAIDLYRGDLLEGLYDDWMLPERERLRQQYLAALEQLVNLHKQWGNYRQALNYAQQLVMADSLHEETHCDLMRLYHLLGHHRAALEQYQTLCRILDTELGVEPMASTTLLAQEIAARLHDPQSPYLPPAPGPTPVFENPDLIPLVGREQERNILLTCLDAALGGQGGLVLVEGEAGVGKTRLLQELVRDAQWRGAQAGWGRGRELAAIPPYGVLREALSAVLSPLRANQLAVLVEGVWLREASRVLPELADWLPDLPPCVTLDPEQQHARLLEALTRLILTLGRIAPHLLILDDLQWADEASLSALIHLTRRLAACRVLVVGCYRDQDAREQPVVWQALQNLDQAGSRLHLARLSAAGAGELVRRSLGLAAGAPWLEQPLYRETDGNPLFVLETLRALQDEGQLYRDQAGAWSTLWDQENTARPELPLPSKVSQVIDRRLAHLNAAERAVLETAAVLGDRFDFGLLTQTGQLDLDPALALVNMLLTRRFLIEAPAAYHFSHDKLREVAYRAIEPGRRQHLHRQAGQALEMSHPEQVEQLAYHFGCGQVWDKAARYHQQAGDQARMMYASAAAAAHYAQALAALEKLPTPPAPSRLVELHLALEEMYALLGEPAHASTLQTLAALAAQLDDPGLRAEVALRQSCRAEVTGALAAAIASARAAIELAQAAGDPQREAAGYLRQGIGLRRQGNYQAAQAQLEQALAIASQHSGEAMRRIAAESLRSLSIVYQFRSDFARAQACCQQAWPIYHELNDRQGESKVLAALGTLSDYLTDYAGAQAYYQQALQICREIGYRRGESDMLNDLGAIYDNQGDYVAARDSFEQALQICHEIGYRQSWLAGNLGALFEALGDYDAALALQQEALAASQEMGDRQCICTALANLCLVYHRLGDNETARDYGQQALTLAQELGDRYVQSFAWVYLGQALAGLEQWDAAAGAYQQAIAIRRDLGANNLAIEALAKLTRVSLAQGDLSLAQSRVEEILACLAPTLEPGSSPGLEGTDEPVLMYFTCYQVLQAAKDPRAQNLLRAAGSLLRDQAARIGDESLRRLFLESITIHRQVMAACQTLPVGAPQQIALRLPCAGAPTGRPLRDEEHVLVVWTTAAPDDENMAGKTARRRHRLLRLLREAAAQSALPTIPDLASALDAAPRTIERDLAALRAAGHTVQTRGRHT